MKTTLDEGKTAVGNNKTQVLEELAHDVLLKRTEVQALETRVVLLMSRLSPIVAITKGERLDTLSEKIIDLALDMYRAHMASQIQYCKLLENIADRAKELYEQNCEK